MNCPKCQNPMEKQAPLISGNSRYEQWKCAVCEHSQLKATNVLN